MHLGHSDWKEMFASSQYINSVATKLTVKADINMIYPLTKVN